jgi:hypothetical protein
MLKAFHLVSRWVPNVLCSTESVEASPFLSTVPLTTVTFAKI